MASADNLLNLFDRAPEPVSLAAVGDELPLPWCPPDNLGAEAIELLEVLRRWPAVPTAVARQHAAAIEGDVAAGDALIALLLAIPDDGRRSPYLSEIVEHGVIWTTTAGHSACGSQRRTSPPSLRKIDHALAVCQVAHDWLAAVEHIRRTKLNGTDELDVTVEPGAEYIADLGVNVAEVIRYAAAADLGPGATNIKSEQQRAWSGKGAVPDLVINEFWHPIIEEAAVGSHPLADGLRPWLSALWPHAIRPESIPDWSPLMKRKPGHHIVAVEVERTVKAPRLLVDKVAAHDAAMTVGAWDAVVWLVDDRATARAVRRAMHAALDDSTQPQLIVATGALSPAASRAVVDGLDSLPLAAYGRSGA